MKCLEINLFEGAMKMDFLFYKLIEISENVWGSFVSIIKSIYTHPIMLLFYVIIYLLMVLVITPAINKYVNGKN